MLGLFSVYFVAARMRLRFTFQIKLFLSLVGFSCVLLAVLGLLLFRTVDEQLHKDLGSRAKVQASQIALMPGLAERVEAEDSAGVAKLVAPLRAKSDASYIVIGDVHADHLYHSQSPERLGKPLVGGDNAEVLEGKTIITVRQGGIGISLRSKAPIVDANNKVIGIVSVGYLISYIDDVTVKLLAQTALSGILLLALLFLFSWLFSKNLKKQMFWLEPKEIALLVRQQKALLEAIYEGVIAIDHQQRILSINHAARELLDIHQPEDLLVGQHIRDIIHTGAEFFTGDRETPNSHDEVTRFNQRQVIVNRVRIELGPSSEIGWVVSFRDKNDINTLSSQLSQVKRYADNLRIMRHEQLNWTATLAGLLQMKRYDEAMGYIQAQSEGAQAVLDFVSERFASPTICGLLLGKYSSAREKGIELTFDPACQLQRMPAALSESELMSIIGNLIDNAVDATLAAPGPHQPVEFYLTDRNDELLIEVADQGAGLSAEIRPRIFEQGATTKPLSSADQTGGEHGIGLYVVASYVHQAQGMIEISDNQPRGTVFSLFIPNPKPPGSNS